MTGDVVGIAPAGAGAAAPDEPLVGPNAVLQMAAALEAEGGPALAARVFATAGLEAWLAHPPERMVPARIAGRLHRVVAACLPEAQARSVAREAGRRTADYILAHRIPRPVQRVLRALPAGLAARILLRAIAAHAWTFAGGARVTYSIGRRPEIAIHANPLATPGCPWHRAVFERLFTRLAGPRIRVSLTACCADAGGPCRFAVLTGG